MKWLLWGCAGLAALYLGVAAALYAVQDALLFPAPSVTRAQLDAEAKRWDAQPVWLHAEDGVGLYGWHRPGDGTRALIFFHGNGAHAAGAGWFGQQLPGVDVLSISYRGYPGSEGHPSEAGFALDARAAWAFVTQTLGIPPERVVVQGQSMGGGVALRLLHEVRPAALVLDSTFTSVEALARDRFRFLPIAWLLRHPFRSDLRAPGVQVPALVLHGDADTLIPVAHGRALADLLPDARYVELPGLGHGHWLLDDPAAYATWRAFVDGHLDGGR